MKSIVTTRGQITIPKMIRKYLGLKAGDRVKFFLHPEQGAVLLPLKPAKALRGLLRSRRGKPVTTDEMAVAAAKGASDQKPGAKRR